jgi:hypothetical protein
LENRELLRIAAKASRISWVVQTLAATHDGQRMIGVTLAGIRQVKIESNLQRASAPRGFRRRARRSIARGEEVTLALLERLCKFSPELAIREPCPHDSPNSRRYNAAGVNRITLLAHSCLICQTPANQALASRCARLPPARPSKIG